MFDAIIPEVQGFAVTLVAGVLSVLAAFLIACAKKGFEWLGTKIDSIKSTEARKVLNNAMCDVENIVTTTVTSLQQTLGDDIKKSILENDGRYTTEDLLALKDKALESIKAQLTASTKEAISTVYTDMDAFLADMVEKTVYNLKNYATAELLTGTAVIEE